MTPAEFEAQRHQTEVARMVRMFREEGKSKVIETLGMIEAKRGKVARERLEADALAALGKA